MDIFFNDKLTEEEVAKLKKEFKKSNGECIAISHLFHVSKSGATNYKDEKEKMKTLFPHSMDSYFWEKSDYLLSLKDKLRSAKKPVLVFARNDKAEGIAELINGLGIKQPVIVIKTEKNVPVPYTGKLDNEKGYDSLDEILSQKEVREETAKLKRLLHKIGVKKATVGGEEAIYLPYNRGELLVGGRCVPCLSDVLRKRMMTAPYKIKTEIDPMITYPMGGRNVRERFLQRQMITSRNGKIKIR